MDRVDCLNYSNQKKRGLERKLMLFNLLGGKCSRCGYKKNIGALEFHHLNPEEKSFQLDMRHLANNSEDVLIEEAKKCVLLCSNCHKEIHYPHLSMDNAGNLVEIFENEIAEKRKPRKKSKYICENCGKEFKAVTNKKFCCAKCRWESRHYPTYEEIKEKYAEFGSWQKVCNFYNLNRNVIRRIRRKAGENC